MVVCVHAYYVYMFVSGAAAEGRGDNEQCGYCPDTDKRIV